MLLVDAGGSDTNGAGGSAGQGRFGKFTLPDGGRTLEIEIGTRGANGENREMKEMFKVEVVDQVMFQVVEQVVMMVQVDLVAVAVVVQEHLYMIV